MFYKSSVKQKGSCAKKNRKNRTQNTLRNEKPIGACIEAEFGQYIKIYQISKTGSNSTQG